MTRSEPVIEGTATGPVLRWSGEFGLVLPRAAGRPRRRGPRPHRARRVRVGEGHRDDRSSTWSTSVFPDASSGSYLLPVKAAVRRTEGIDHGDLVTARLVSRCRSVEEGVDEGGRVEGGEVVGTLAEADELHRDAELALDGHDDAALGVPSSLVSTIAGHVDDSENTCAWRSPF